MRELATQGDPVDVVHERPLPVDLDDRQPLAIPRLELWIAADVNLGEVESELVSSAANRRERPLAEMAPLRVVDDDAGYG